MKIIHGLLTVVVAAAVVVGVAMSGRAAVPAASTPSVPANVRAIFDKPVYKHSTWSLRVLDGTKVLIDMNSQRSLLIGSVRKIFTVGQLLDTIGGAHRFDTPAYRSGNIDGGVLHGNLIVVASGDLTMGGRTNPDGSIAVSNWDHNEADSLGNAILTKPDPLAGYRMLARAVRAAGIKRIAGNVVIDDRLFQPYRFRGEFDVRPIFVNDDVVDLSVRPGGTPGSSADVVSRPSSAALKIDNRLRNGAANSKNTLAVKPEFPACIGSTNCTASIGGSLPIDFVPPLTGQPVLVQTVRIVQPSNYARSVLVEALAAQGVAVNAPAVAANPVRLLPPKSAYANADRVAQLTGQSYANDAKLILKISYNIGADTSLLLFGVAHHVDTMEAALRVERQTLQSHYGIPANDYHFVDGSGGGDTTATGRAVTQMLEELAKSREAPAFTAALPVLGIDGSLAFVKSFQSDPTLRGATGKVRAKTGTFVGPSPSGVVLKGQALAGYIATRRGRHLTFELVVNNVPISNIDDITKVFQDQGNVAARLWRDY